MRCPADVLLTTAQRENLWTSLTTARQIMKAEAVARLKD